MKESDGLLLASFIFTAQAMHEVMCAAIGLYLFYLAHKQNEIDQKE